MSRLWFVGLLPALGLLLGHAVACMGQSASSPLAPVEPPPSGVAPTTNNETATVEGAPPLFGPIRPVSPWYLDAESALLVNVAMHFNTSVSSVGGDNAVYASSRLFLGYGFESGGSIRLTYRNLTEVGRLGWDGSGDGWSADTNFNANWIDLDFVTREYCLRPGWNVQVEAGARFATRRSGWEYQGQNLREDYTQTYYGGGPHLGLVSRCCLGCSGWTLFNRADTAVTFGSGKMKYNYTPLQADLATFGLPTMRADSHGECQFDLNLQMGLMNRWELERCAVGVGFGVQAEVLSMGALDHDYFDMYGFVNVGAFLRCEVNF